MSDQRTRDGQKIATERRAPAVDEDDSHVIERYDNRRTTRAWEDFISGRSARVDGQLVRSVILQSWERSMASGVAAESSAAPFAGDRDVVYGKIERNAELIDAARVPMARLGGILNNTPAMLILTDADGVIIETVGEPRTLDNGRNIHLEIGGAWHEELIGTNGIGTALATGRPALVHAAEHFCSGIRNWTCAGAPIRDPVDNRVLGVIDLSGPPEIFQPHNVAYVTTAARSVERSLAEAAMVERAELLEAFLKSGEPINEDDGLIILDRQGRVIFARHPMRERSAAAASSFTFGQRLVDPSQLRRDADILEALPAEMRRSGIDSMRLCGRVDGTAIIVPSRPPRRSAFATPETMPVTRSETEPVIIGNSAALREALELTRRMAKGSIPLLFEGETGVGKELFARFAHATFRTYPSDPFIVVNCAAISREDLAAELFGRAAGSASGADQGSAGKFEAADGGTICLDEIGEMPLDMQPYLLRVVEEQSVCRLGETRARPINVRVLATTNRFLRADVAAGTFRRDLFFRIGAVAVSIPPLRDRPGDTGPLLQFFNEKVGRRLGLEPLLFEDEALAALAAYGWPGNVRELINLVEMLHLTCADRRVALDSLPAAISRPFGPGAEGARPAIGLKEAERNAITRAIEAEQGNMTRVASLLNISRATLYRKIHMLGIRRDRWAGLT